MSAEQVKERSKEMSRDKALADAAARERVRCCRARGEQPDADDLYLIGESE